MSTRKGLKRFVRAVSIDQRTATLMCGHTLEVRPGTRKASATTLYCMTCKRRPFPPPIPHGTKSGYCWHCCRCRPCRDAYNAWARAARARARARKLAASAEART